MHPVDELTVFFNTKSKPFLVIVNVAILFGIGVVDYFTGYEIGVSLFYLIPISFAAWFGGKTPGIIISSLSVLTIAVTDVMAGKEFPRHFVEFWNLFMHFGFFVVYSVVISIVKDAYEKNLQLIDELKKAEELEKATARKDSLTGIANWRAFLEIAEREISRSRRKKCVIFFCRK